MLVKLFLNTDEIEVLRNACQVLSRQQQSVCESNNHARLGDCYDILTAAAERGRADSELFEQEQQENLS
tara:strand:+ start:252 stop:458 length:207 start_codon:yes stop_codon:yes gene_type:complete